MYIPIILGSTREGRQSDRAARFVHRHLSLRDGAETEILDLLTADLPMLVERLDHLEDPPRMLVEWDEKLSAADALIVVSPEYNRGYPGVLKNALDHFPGRFRRKPIAIVTVSSGPFGGLSALGQLQLVMLSMGALPIPAPFPVTRVQDSFDPEGKALDQAYERRVERFLDELLWYAAALASQG
jgi:NAD(P)H-dependent FMN reductase